MQEAAAASEKAKKEHDELVCQLEATKKQLAEERATQAELKKTRAEQEELVRQLEAARKQLEAMEGEEGAGVADEGWY